MDFEQTYYNFLQWCTSQHIPLNDLFPTVEKTEAYPIDLSLNNTLVKTEAEFNNPQYFTKQLNSLQKENPTKIIAGGYLEKRALYTSDIYNALNTSEKRNIHLALDFWLPEHTPVHAVFDGEVVCATHQTELKGYGGFIILKHIFETLEFNTLYGHLSKESVMQFSQGDVIKKGEKIGALGNYKENGEWVPHLHFQIMLNLLDYQNDFPGVALESELDYWKNICPNPNLLFKLNSLN